MPGRRGQVSPLTEEWQAATRAKYELSTLGFLPERCLERLPALYEPWEALVAVGETVILLHPPVPLSGVSMGINRGCRQNDRSLADG